MLTPVAGPGLFEAIFENMPVPAFVYGPDLRIRGFNRAAQSALHVPAESALGAKCKQALGCVSCDPACALLLGLHQDSARGPVEVRSPDGKRRTAMIRTASAGEATVSIIGAVTDSVAPEVEPVAGSELMRGVIRFAHRVAASEAASILLQGENGTGKDLIARLLHDRSPRKREPFVAINCAAMPETLLESELFGYEKGAFTDARSQKHGLFELAGTGTLFLDEIGELPLKLQAKLLRVLEDQTFRRLGGLTDVRIHSRIVAATNRNLMQAVANGEFRQDLYYRLNIIEIIVPPLRARREDIMPLAEHFIERYNRRFGRAILGLSPQAAALLMNHDWPGNVRELKNAIERAAILEESDVIRPGSLPPELSPPGGTPCMSSNGTPQPAGNESLHDHEMRLLAWALEKSGGNQTKAAALLGVGRDLLRYRMKKFQLLPSKMESVA